MAGELLPGENLILKLHQHWIFVAKSLMIPVALLLLTVVADIVLGSTSASNIRLPLTLAVVAIAILWLIVVWIRWQSIVYTLTDQRIKLESGVFSRSEKIIPIDRIQDCTTRQSLLGRMLGYGRVEVDAAGAQGAEVLEHCPSPVCFVTTCLCSRSGGAVCEALRPASQASEPTSRRPRRALRSSASWVRERAWWERLWLTARERRSTTSIS